MLKQNVYSLLILIFLTGQKAKSQEIKTNMEASNKNFTTTVLVNKSQAEVFNAINKVSEWWSEEIEGKTDKLGSEFSYHFQDVHQCKMKITELIPGKKVVWLVEENYFKFTKNQNEWPGTEIIFEILKDGDKTKLIFTHKGLVPGDECYDICRDAWTGYIQNSLQDLITIGKGKPNGKDKPQTENEKKLSSGK